MKLAEGIKQSGKPFYIPNCPRSELPQFFADTGFKTGAEVGVYKGKFCEKFCQKGLKMYAIDNWAPEVVASTQERADYIYNYARRVLSRFKDCIIIKKSSMEAVKEIPLNSLDFVYIDCDHSFKGIAEDLVEWYKKVRSGGIISGHDYSYTGNDPRATRYFNSNSHVPYVVDAFVKSFDIPNFYVFGRSKPIELESKNDRYLSWLFFKP